MFASRCCLTATVCLVLAQSFHGSTAAQTLSADEKEIAAYKLTMATVEKVAAVMQSLASEAAQDPKAKELAKVDSEIKELEKKEELTEAEEAKLEKLRDRQQELQDQVESSSDSGNAKTLDEMVAQIKRSPSAMRALAREGLTPREYATCTFALLQAAMVEGLSQGKADPVKLPPGVNPENVRFVREHKAELEALQGAMTGGVKK